MKKGILVAALVALLSLGGCSHGSIALVNTVRVAPEIPPSLRQCKDIPAVPPRGSTQRDVALYIIDLHEALEDCKRTHGALVAVIDDFQNRIKEQAKGD